MTISGENDLTTTLKKSYFPEALILKIEPDYSDYINHKIREGIVTYFDATKLKIKITITPFSF